MLDLYVLGTSKEGIIENGVAHYTKLISINLVSKKETLTTHQKRKLFCDNFIKDNKK